MHHHTTHRRITEPGAARALRRAAAACVSVLFVLLPWACGKTGPDGTNTNWLRQCVTSSECAEGACICSVCTLACQSSSECSAASGTRCVAVTALPERCAAASGSACLVRCESDAECAAVGASARCRAGACEQAAAAATAEAGLEAGSEDAGYCSPVSPTTDSGTCPVFPRSGLICTAPSPPELHCGGGSGGCIYPSYANAPQTCPAVCPDQNGNCPPASSVCTPVPSCKTAADCTGALPETCGKSCPLLSDGSASSDGCSRWACTDGYCAVETCPPLPNLFCQAGYGCPSYYLPAFDRSCQQDSDCVAVTHGESEIVTVALGISAREEARFAAAEAACAAVRLFMGLGAPPMLLGVDGGSLVGDGAHLVAVCQSGTCEAFGAPPTCGAVTCAPGESCCMSPIDGGQCTYTCAATCPVALAPFMCAP